jgi:hypothetical protein
MVWKQSGLKSGSVSDHGLKNGLLALQLHIRILLVLSPDPTQEAAMTGVAIEQMVELR